MSKTKWIVGTICCIVLYEFFSCMLRGYFAIGAEILFPLVAVGISCLFSADEKYDQQVNHLENNN